MCNCRKCRDKPKTNYTKSGYYIDYRGICRKIKTPIRKWAYSEIIKMRD